MQCSQRKTESNSISYKVAVMSILMLILDEIQLSIKNLLIESSWRRGEMLVKQCQPRKAEKSETDGQVQGWAGAGPADTHGRKTHTGYG